MGAGGHETINGRTGADRLTGRGGSDGHGEDTICGFNITSRMTVIAVSGVSGLNSTADVRASVVNTSLGARIDTDGGDSILVLGVNLNALGANDFLFRRH